MNEEIFKEFERLLFVPKAQELREFLRSALGKVRQDERERMYMNIERAISLYMMRQFDSVQDSMHGARVLQTLKDSLN